MLGVEELLTRFAATICNGPLGLIDNAPALEARPMESIPNVVRKIQQDGGRALFGWVFLNRASAHGEYLIAMHHAIWNPAGSEDCVDITPFHDDARYRPYAPAPAKVLFLLDASAEPKFIGNAIAQLPSRYFAATEAPDLLTYVAQLNEEEQSHFQKLTDGAAKH